MNFIVLLIATVYTQVLATFHDYEADRQALGAAYDNSPGWCGIRYSVLNVARITAINGMNENLCGSCLAVQNVNGGPVVHVLAVDQKQGAGLDIAKSSYHALNPSGNPLDPSTVTYRIVDQSLCSGICQGSQEECTPGLRNLLPASLLPSRPMVPATLGGTGSGGSISVTVTTRISSTSTSSPTPNATPSVIGSAPEAIYGIMSTSDASCIYLLTPFVLLLLNILI